MIIEEIRDLTKILQGINGLEQHKIDYILNYIKANSIPKEVKSLPDVFKSGFDLFDYLVYPIQNTSRILIYGPPGSGKTALISEVIRSIIESFDIQVLWLDSNFKLNSKFFQKLNINDNLSFFQTININRELIDYIRSSKYKILVVDDIASFKEDENFNQLMVTCKINRVMVIAANQIRMNPTNGRPYSPKHHLLTQYDTSMKIVPYSKHHSSGYSDYNLKLEYNQQQGLMTSQSVVIPIHSNGLIKHDLCQKRLERLLRTNGAENINEFIERRK